MFDFLNSKKFKIIFSWFIFLFLISSHFSFVFAQNQTINQTTPSPLPLQELENLKSEIEKNSEIRIISENPIMVALRIINYLLGFIGVLFILMIIYGGLIWMTGGTTSFFWLTEASPEERVKKAKEVLTSAIAGLVIVILARVIYYFVLERLKGARGGPGGGGGG